MTLSIKPSSLSGVGRAEAARDVVGADAAAAPQGDAEAAAVDDVAAPVDPIRQGAARAAALGIETAVRDRLGSPAVSGPVDGPRRGLGQAPLAAPDDDGRVAIDVVDEHGFDAMSLDPDVRERDRVPNRRTASGETIKNPPPKRVVR